MLSPLLHEKGGPPPVFWVVSPDALSPVTRTDALGVAVDRDRSAWVLGLATRAGGATSWALWRMTPDVGVLPGFPRFGSGRPSDIAIDASGAIWMAGGPGRAMIWRLDEDGAVLDGYPTRTDHPRARSLHVSADGGVWAAGGDATRVTAWEVGGSTGREVDAPSSATTDVAAGAVGPCGRVWIVGSVDGQAAFWRFERDDTLATGFPHLHPEASAATDVAIDGEGAVAVSGSVGTAAALWRFE